MSDDTQQAPATASLSALRSQIDAVDRQLLELLAKRAELACAISAAKQILHRPVRDETREQAALLERTKWASQLGLDQRFVDELFHAIMLWSRAVQEESRPR